MSIYDRFARVRDNIRDDDDEANVFAQVLKLMSSSYHEAEALNDITPYAQKLMRKIRAMGNARIRFHEASTVAAKKHDSLFEGESLVVGFLSTAELNYETIVNEFIQETDNKLNSLSLVDEDDDDPFGFRGSAIKNRGNEICKSITDMQSKLDKHIEVIELATSKLNQLVELYSQDKNRYQYLTPALRLIQSFSNVFLLPISLLDPEQEFFVLNPQLVNITDNLREAIYCIEVLNRKCV